MKSDKINIAWDDETGTATCILTDGTNTFVGISTCHPDDLDMCSQITGSEIAHMRASIKYLQHIKNNELKPKIKVLKHLESCMRTSKKFNPKSYENVMMHRELQRLQDDLDAINYSITEQQEGLKSFIDQKEKTFKRIRALHAQKQTDKIE